MAAPTDAAGLDAAGHATWPDVALWVLQHDGLIWALVAALLLIALWKADTIIPALSAAADRWDARRRLRRQEKRELLVAQERLNADMRAVERQLRLAPRDPPERDEQGG